MRALTSRTAQVLIGAFGSTAALVAGCVALTAPQRAAGSSPPLQPTCRPAPAPSVFTSASSTPIPDAGVATSQIPVTGVVGQIVDVDVRTNIRHAAPGELEIVLISPSGIQAPLSTGNGGTAADVFNGTLWDDEADPDGQVPYAANANLATDHPYAAGVVATPLAPEHGLSSIGAFGAGVWTLRVTDTTAGNAGTIDSWSLSLTIRPQQNFFGGNALSASFSSSTVVAIDAATANTVASTIVVPPRDANYIAAAPRLTTNISHTRSDDLDITLTSPAGTVVTLTTDNGNGLANVFAGTSWGDTNPAPGVTDIGFSGPAGSLVPEEPLAAFIGEDPAGSWTLTVSDDTPSEGGVLNGWTLSLAADGCHPDMALRLEQTPTVARAGAPLVLGVTATVGPELSAQDLVVTAQLPPALRFVRLTPSAGGACTATKIRTTQPRISCTWPGPSPVGTDRSFQLAVLPFIAGSHDMRVTLSHGITVRGPINFVPPLRVAVAPSDLRAANGRRCTMLGTAGDDTLSAASLASGSAAVVCGLGGRDRLTGGRSADVLDGGPGDDVLAGGAGNDVLIGGQGRDNLSGGAGRDLLNGGFGADALRGGSGIDTAVAPSGDTQISIERVR
jgi:subtilisin-like proprotein convertase family protein